MRVLRIIASTRPSAGGPIEALLQTALALRKGGHTTEIVALDPPDGNWLRDVPFQVHALGPRTRTYGYTPRLVPWLKRRRDAYDVAIVHGLWLYPSFAAWRALAGGPLPYVVFTHGMLDPWFKREYPLKHLAKQAFWLAGEGRVLRDAAAVLFTTEEERRLASTSFWGFDYRERVVAYGTADVPNGTEAQRSALRAAVRGLGDRPFLLFLSRIHPKKGCDLLVRAFAALSDRFPDLALVMAGPDQVGWRSALEDLAHSLGVAGRVLWPGMLSGDAKWGALRGANALVLPSHQENFGIVVAEAMACGTPVLLTDKVNIWREVERSGGGMVAADDDAGVTSLLQRFLSLTPAERRTMGAHARESFLAHFHIDAAAGDLIAVLEEARNQHRASTGRPSRSGLRRPWAMP